jgi:hypothetical protein
VSQRSLDEIDKIYKEKQGWHMTIPYDKKEDISILKLMVSVVHECAML